EGLDLVVLEDLVEARLLDVEDLAAQGEDGLELAVPALLGAAAGRVAFDDVDFAPRGVLAGAVGELAGEAHAVQEALAARQLAGLAGGFAGAGGLDALLQDHDAYPGVLLEEGGELLGDGALHDALDLAVAQLGLRLAFELRIGDLHREDGGQPFARVVAGEVLVVLLQQLPVAGVLVEHPGQGALEAHGVRAALVRVDVVDEGEDVLRVRVGPLHGQLDLDVLALGGEVDDVAVQRLARAVEPLDELHEAALGEERLRALAHLVLEGDPEALVEEAHLPQARGDGVEVERGGAEDLRVGLEADGGAVVGLAALAQDVHGLREVTALHADGVELAQALAAHDDGGPLGERGDHRAADAVEA